MDDLDVPTAVFIKWQELHGRTEKYRKQDKISNK